MNRINSFPQGIRDGISIGLGYLSVSCAFGVIAVGSGLSVLEALMVSMLNVTSAGQLAAVPILSTLGSVIELVLTQVVINIRYALMSISLSQRLDKDVRVKQRMIVGFLNTDEVFGVAVGKGAMLGKKYLFGLILPPYLGWSLGTLIGAVLGEILPMLLTNALGIALYAMFIAIVVPEGRANRKTALCILVSAALSCAFFFLPGLKEIQTGFAIIIVAITVSLIFALLAPIDEEVADSAES